jgi:hypothetical protein
MKATNLGIHAVRKLRYGSLVPGDAPHDQGHLLVGKLSNVHACGWMTFVKSPDEYVGQFIEFSKLPLRERRVLSSADRRWILAIFLQTDEKCKSNQRMVHTSKYRKNEYIRR